MGYTSRLNGPLIFLDLCQQLEMGVIPEILTARKQTLGFVISHNRCRCHCIFHCAFQESRLPFGIVKQATAPVSPNFVTYRKLMLKDFEQNINSPVEGFVRCRLPKESPRGFVLEPNRTAHIRYGSHVLWTLTSQ
jgi:hypothetical protein